LDKYYQYINNINNISSISHLHPTKRFLEVNGAAQTPTDRHRTCIILAPRLRYQLRKLGSKPNYEWIVTAGQKTFAMHLDSVYNKCLATYYLPIILNEKNFKNISNKQQNNSVFSFTYSKRVLKKS